MTLKYTIQFLDYWHLSSGLSAGAKLDSLVVKDSNDLPYAPGKTLKGLIREMAELLEDCDFVNSCFGGSTEDGKNGKPKDKCYDENAKNKQGVCYFSNATLEKQEQDEIVTNRLQNHLYHVIASTAIGENGIAIDHSLREIEVVIPLTLHATIENIPAEYGENIRKATTMLKSMGLNRTRGFGRCTIKGELS